MNERVTVVLPVYNGENFIEDALRSVAAQSFENYKVFVSNNASTDRTLDIVQNYSKRLPLEVVTHQLKLSMFDNFLYAFEQIRTPYFLVLCHDDYLASPNALRFAVDILEKQPDISSVYCDLEYVNAKGSRLLRRNFRREGRIDGECVGKASVKSARNMFGIPLLVRTAALKHYVPDKTLTYVGDVDFSWQISKTGPIYHIPRILFANRFGSHNSTWAVISQAAQQFRKVGEKHGMKLSLDQWAILLLKGWALTQQKRLFGYYAQYRSRLD